MYISGDVAHFPPWIFCSQPVALFGTPDSEIVQGASDDAGSSDVVGHDHPNAGMALEDQGGLRVQCAGRKKG